MPRPPDRPLPPARFVCPGCGLSFSRRRAAHPGGLPPFRCLCCSFVATIQDVRMREALRRAFGRARPQSRLGGRDAAT